MPDLLFLQELAEHGGAVLIELGLRVEALDSEGVSLALTYHRANRALSLPDCFALALAKCKSWILLSGDRQLRQLATRENVSCHGVLWVIDRITEQGVLSDTEIITSLQSISAHPQCRLPRQEIQKRLNRLSLR